MLEEFMGDTKVVPYPKTPPAALPVTQAPEPVTAATEPKTENVMGFKGRDGMAYVRQITLPLGKVATHEDRDGLSYALRSDTWLEMTAEQSYTFLIDPAFEVRNSAGEVITPVSTNTVEAGRIDLAADEVIANYNELTREALVKRCKKHPGSETYSNTTRRDVLTAFLVAVAETKTYGVGRGSEDVMGTLGDGTLDSMGLDPLTNQPVKTVEALVVG